MEVISRHRRRLSIASALTLLALILSLGLAVAFRADGRDLEAAGSSGIW